MNHITGLLYKDDYIIVACCTTATMWNMNSRFKFVFHNVHFNQDVSIDSWYERRPIFQNLPSVEASKYQFACFKIDQNEISKAKQNTSFDQNYHMNLISVTIIMLPLH